MRLTLSFIGLTAAAALLAACSKPAPADASKSAEAAAPTAPAAPAAPAAAPAGPPGPITLADLPSPKEGLWQRVSTNEGEAPSTDTKCLAHKPLDPTKDGPKCAKITVMRTATGGFTVDGDCPNNGMTAKLHAAGEGDFNSAFTTDGEMTLGQPGSAPMTMKNHTVYKYVGACPAGQTPE